jgi:2,3,4,5-tetrahydropyridine-2,6-dicarboxylate N-succinyltransferase
MQSTQTSQSMDECNLYAQDARFQSRVRQCEIQIAAAVENSDLLASPETQSAIVFVLRCLEKGLLRVATPKGTEPWVGAVEMAKDLQDWTVHSWVKQAVLLALRWRVAQKMGGSDEHTIAVSDFERVLNPSVSDQGRIFDSQLCYFDKLDARSDLHQCGVRIVPPGMVREGAFVAPGCIVMPGFVNVGAYVSAGTMVDTWATVGSCAQIGKNVHLAGGVGIGGVLEPAGARPVMIGDNAFVGSRAIVVEGAVVSHGAVLGANVCITASTPIYDVTNLERTAYRGFVPPYAVVAPGTRPKSFPGGEVQLQCSYIIGWRSGKTDSKVSLNEALRETGISV